MSCNNCNNVDENETLYWDNELDKPNMIDYTCLCQSCYNKKEKQQYKQSFSVMTTDELMDIIIDQDKRLTIYEEKDRNNIKQGKGE